MNSDVSPSGVLARLREVVADAPLQFPLPDGEAARREQRELVDQIDDYLIPRLKRLDAPLLAVLSGSTGSGKSTLVNSLTGENVSKAGVLRPTTRSPVLVCHPDDQDWFMQVGEGGILPGMARSTGQNNDTNSLHVVTSTSLPAGLAILDAPDIDSIETANHELAAQLMASADMLLFTTTAARYADAVPWDYLARIRDRGAQLAIILNRIPVGASDEVSSHLATMLDAKGLQTTRLFSVETAELVEERIPKDRLEELTSWISHLAADSEARKQVVASTLNGALASLSVRAEHVIERVDWQLQAAENLRTLKDRRYEKAMDEIKLALGTGTLLRREVLDRWQEYVGQWEFMRSLQSTIGRIRDSVVSIFTGETPPDREVQGALETGIETIITHQADEAALDVVQSWKGTETGRSLLDDTAGLDRASRELKQRASPSIREWQQSVMDLVAAEAGDRRDLARALSFGVNGIGVTLMVAIFAHTGGITGGEVAVTGGTATVSQALLTALFGEQAVRSLAAKARDGLLERIKDLLTGDSQRFDRFLAGAGSTEYVSALRKAAAEASALKL